MEKVPRKRRITMDNLRHRIRMAFWARVPGPLVLAHTDAAYGSGFKLTTLHREIGKLRYGDDPPAPRWPRR